MFFLSPSGTVELPSLSIRTSTILLTGTDSPVRAASSAFMLCSSMRRQSAGTASPASSTTISPTTMSSDFTTCISPSLRTFEVAAVICIRAVIAASALLSWTRLMMVLSTTTTSMTMTSAKPLSVGFPPASMIATTACMAAAAISIMIMGSARDLMKRFPRLSFSASLSLFLPFCSSLFAASSELRPLSQLPISASTASFSLR